MKSKVASVGSITVWRCASSAMKSCTGLESKSSPAAFSRQVEALERARVGLRRDEEVQQHLVDVLDLVESRVDDVLRAQERRHVAADAHAAAVRVGRGVAQDVLGERVVDLDLRIAVLRRTSRRRSSPRRRSLMTKPLRADIGLSPSMKPAGTMRGDQQRRPASSSLIISCRVVLSLPMSRTVVTPAARCSPPSQRERWRACRTGRAAARARPRR